MESLGKQATARLKHVDALIMESEAKILAELADGAIGTARVVDETLVNLKNAFPKLTPDPGLVFVEGAAK